MFNCYPWLASCKISWICIFNDLSRLASDCLKIFAVCWWRAKKDSQFYSMLMPHMNWTIVLHWTLVLWLSINFWSCFVSFQKRRFAPVNFKLVPVTWRALLFGFSDLRTLNTTWRLPLNMHQKVLDKWSCCISIVVSMVTQWKLL